MEINTVRDYIVAGCPEGNFLFQSKHPIRNDNATKYSLVNCVELGDTYLFVEPINGKSLDPEFKRVNIPTWQHLEDKVFPHNFPLPFQ